MKIIIAGFRDISNYDLVETAIEASGFKDDITHIVSGCCRGVDKLGEIWATDNGVPEDNITRFPAFWNLHGKAAGSIRNEEMAIFADGLIAIWDGKSSGTKDMIEKAINHGLKVFVFDTSKTFTKRSLF